LEQGVAPFLFYPPYFYDKTSISFNPQTSIYLKSVLNKIPPIG